ncbi:hypothetical protein LguiA_023607 [Lonicera macranthoides]
MDDEHDHVITADNETTVENLGSQGHVEGSFCAGNVEGEIMVELVGSDVLVDGVSGHGGGDELGEDNLGRESERETIDAEACVSSDFDDLQEVGDLGNRELNARIESGLSSVQEIESSLRTCEVAKEASLQIAGSSIGSTQVVAEKFTGIVSEERLGKGLAAGVVEHPIEPAVEVGVDHLSSQNSQPVDVLDNEVWNPGTEARVLCSPLMEEPLSANMPVVPESGVVMITEESLNSRDETLDTNVVEVNLPGPAKDQIPSVVNMEIDDGIVVGNAALLDQQAEVSGGGEVGVMDKAETLHPEFDAKKTDVIGNLSSSVENEQMHNNTACESYETHGNLGVDSVPSTELPKVEGAATDDKSSSDSNAEGSKSSGLRDQSEDQQLKVENMGESSKGDADVDVCTKTESSSAQNEFVRGNQDTIVDRKVQIPKAEVQNVKCESSRGHAEKVYVDANLKAETVLGDCTGREGFAQEDSGTSTEQILVVEDVFVCENPSLLGTEVHDASVMGTDSTALEVGKGEGHVVVQQAETPGLGVDWDQNLKPKFVGDISNEGTCSISTTVALHGGDQSIGTCVSDVGTFNEVVTQAIEVQGEPCKADEVRKEQIKDGVICEDSSLGSEAHDMSTRRTGAAAFEDNKGEELVGLLQAEKLTPEVDWDQRLNQLSVAQISNKGVCSTALAHTNAINDGGQTMGTSASDAVTSSELLNQTIEVVDFHCIEDDAQGMVGNTGLQFSECSDAIAAGDRTGLGSNVGLEVQVEKQHNEGEHVDLHREQGTEVKEQSTEIEQSMAIDEKIPEQMTLKPGSSVNEGEFSVSDLVWGKVRSHPWWPGQIFDPVDASETATKYHKKDCFLVAYFGDRTFAWNDASLLKPFRTYFSQIDKQSNSEAFHFAVTSALEEVSRRVQLGLTCSCVPKEAYEMIESQIVENTGIRSESSRRYGVDQSTELNSFEPNKLVEGIRALAKSPFGGGDRLELAVAKAQLLAFSRFKGYSGLPEFQLCGGLLETNADTSQFSEAVEHATTASEDSEGVLKGENISSHKRKHKLTDSLYPRKKERPMSELMSDVRDSPEDSEDGDGDGDGPDSKVASKSVSSSASRKRKAIDSVTGGSDKRISFYAAKVSTTASSPTSKSSFRVGECIRRVASQLTGSPSLLKCSSQKSTEDNASSDHLVGFYDSFHTPENSQKGKTTVSQEDSSLDEMLVQLRSAARDPMKGYSFLNSIIPFFSSFRHSIASGLYSAKRNSSSGRLGGGGRKKKVSLDEKLSLNAAVSTPKEFEFDDVNESNDSYWTDRVVQNYEEEQPLDNSQNGGEYPPVVFEPDNKPLKSSRRSYSRKRFSSGNHEVEAEEPTEHIEVRKQVMAPTGLILNFMEGGYVPSEINLNKMFRRFGALKESETEVDRQANRARVVFKKGSDAEVAINSAAKFNIFGPMPVNYELSYLPSLSFKSMPLQTLQGQEDAS